MAVFPAETALFPQIQHPKKRQFLLAFCHSGRIRYSCKIAHIDPRYHYYWLKADADYAQCVETARQMAGDYLEEVAIARATDSERPSDTLLIFLLKGAMPEKYRENVKIETDLTVHLEASLTQGAKRLEVLRGRHDLSA